MKDIILEQLAQEVGVFGLVLDAGQLKQLDRFAAMLVEWNEQMNLTAITDDEGIARKHFVDSLSLLPHLKPGASVIDVGTGAGFPGLPLAIARPDLKVVLLDSLEKRIRFLNAVKEALHLDGIRTQHGRAEDFGRHVEWRDTHDVAVSRAVAPLPVLLEYCLPFVRPGGLFLAMKGPGAVQEAAVSQQALERLGGKLEEIVTFLLPGTEMERNLIRVKKTGRTPKGYPRKSGKPAREPL